MGMLGGVIFDPKLTVFGVESGSVSIGRIFLTGRTSARTASLQLRPLRDMIRRANRCAMYVACSS